jgi:hypothetical protein
MGFSSFAMKLSAYTPYLLVQNELALCQACPALDLADLIGCVQVQVSVVCAMLFSMCAVKPC